MPDVLIDVRCMQRDAVGPEAVRTEWVAVLQQGRAALPGARLVGLIDPDLPPLATPARACLDAICRNAYAAGAPSCFVRLESGSDEMFSARLLQAGIPSVAVAPATATKLARYWLARTDRVATPASLWPTVAALSRAPAERPGRLAVLSNTRDSPLCHALRADGAGLFGAETLPLLSDRFDLVLFVIGNTAADAALIRLLRRYGGAALITESCLLGAYADAPDRAQRLAEHELGRAVVAVEMQQWIEGIARPAALLLGEVVEAAETLFVHSAWLAGEIAARYGGVATVLPAPAAVRVRAHAAGLHAESCVWAVETLQFWGVAIRLDLLCPQPEQERLTALARRLGIADRIGFDPGMASVCLFLALRGGANLSAALIEAGTAGLRCIASRSVIEAVDPPFSVTTLPDQPSPPLLAEAILAALPGPRDDIASPSAVAAQLRAALDR